VTDPQQLPLIEAPPKLTERQARALAFIQACGTDGATATETGRHLGATEMWAKSSGLEVSRALKKKGLVRQRKGGIWVATNPTSDTGNIPELAPGMLPHNQELPY
jgi:hypothetical protein